MNALNVRASSFWLLMVDETGPIGGLVSIQGSWRHLELEVIAQLVRASHPGLTVLKVEWAERPRDYTISDDVLLVRIPGTHEVPAPKARRALKPRKAVVEVREPAEEPADDYGPSKSYWTYQGHTAPARKPVVLDAVEVITTCPKCGALYTAAAFAQLELVSAGDRREGGMIIHETTRRCACGAERMVASSRIAGGDR